MLVGNELRFGLLSFCFSHRSWPVPVLGICETLSDINLECVGTSIALCIGHQTYNLLTQVRLSIV